MPIPLRSPGPLRILALEDRTAPALFVGLAASGLTLVNYDSDTPGTVIGAPIPVTGLDAGATLVGIDYRVPNGKLYGVSSNSRLYTIEGGGAATPVGVAFSTPLNGTKFGVDFNPAVDKLRIVSNTNQNLRVNADTGGLVMADTPQTYDAARYNEAVADGAPPTPVLVATAYTRNQPLAGQTKAVTTQYVIDGGVSLLSTQGKSSDTAEFLDPPTNAQPNPEFVSPNSGKLFVVDKLGFTAGDTVGFDIQPDTDLALISVGNKLYSVNLATAGTVSVGNLPAAANFIDLAFLPPAAGAGTVAFASTTATFNPDTRGPIALTVTRTGGSSQAATIDFATGGGNATSGVDYFPATGTLTFAPGETTKLIPLLLPAGAAPPSAAETFNVTLSNPTGGAVLGANAVATVTIPAVTAPAFGGTIGLASDTFGFASDRSPLTITVNRTGGLTETATVNFATVAGTALAGTDFVAQSGTLTFGPNVTSQTITLALPAGSTATGNRSFTVVLSSPSAQAALASFIEATVTLPAGTSGGLPAGVIVNGQPTIVRPRAAAIGTPQFSVGGPNGSVTVLNPDRTVVFTATGLPGFTGAVRSAVADFTGDGVADVLVGTGPGAASRVAVINGATKAVVFTFDPFEASFTGGVFVAAGDVNGDGVPDIIVTPDEGGGPRVRIFSGAGSNPQINDFFGIEDVNFRGGARAAAGDLNGDGRADLIVAAGFGGGPRVAVFDGNRVGDPLATGALPPKLYGDFFVYEEGLRNGAFVSVGDVTGDGFGDLVTGAGPGGGPRVRVFNGRDLLARNFNTGAPGADFFAGDPNNSNGVRVAVKDLDNDGQADLVTAAGSGRTVTGYFGKALTATPPAAFTYDADASLGGVFVG